MLLPGLPCILSILLRSSVSVAQKSRDLLSQPDPPHDCKDGYSNWQTEWADEKKLWCCGFEGRGCSREIEPDCNAGYWNWKEGWSRAKKDWCCKYKQLACIGGDASDTSSGTDSGHAGSGTSDSARVPSPVGQASKTSSTTTDSPYNCDSDLALFDLAWSEEKKSWCCRRTGKGCAVAAATSTEAVATTLEIIGADSAAPAGPTSTRPPYNCTSDVALSDLAWSNEKKKWCCRHVNLGCPGSGATTTAATASSGVTGAAASATSASSNAPTGPGTAASAPPAGSNSARSAARNAATTYAPPAGSTSASSAGRSTATATAAEKYDCMAGFADWARTWPGDKQAWCCKNAALGCAADKQSFNCSLEVKNFRTSWSESKKAWCCKDQGIGCKIIFRDGHYVYYTGEFSVGSLALNGHPPSGLLVHVLPVGILAIAVTLLLFVVRYTAAGCSRHVRREQLQVRRTCWAACQHRRMAPFSPVSSVETGLL
mmetsp:Transcript_88008/g.244274  ORF Transcript_88008/g.244274 Transcript_88008/m.244274 type:complete len:485 (+) Transcript_88008:108-1562(+)